MIQPIFRCQASSRPFLPPGARAQAMGLAALLTPARAFAGVLRQCVRFNSGGKRRNWNLRAPDGWIYARHLKKKYGKDYLTKQEWARRNGTWKGAISRPPYAKQTCQRRTATEPPACALQVPRPGNSSPGRGWARPSPVYKEMQCRSWRRPMISSCSFAFAYDTVSVTGLLRMPRRHAWTG